jgi:hypothetical protein
MCFILLLRLLSNVSVRARHQVENTYDHVCVDPELFAPSSRNSGYFS